MGRQKDSVPGLDGDQWCGLVAREWWNEFYDQWHDRLDKYDAFVCFYPPLFAYLYRRFNKPIICQFPIRYEYPCQSEPAQWEAFNAYLRDGVDNGRIFLSANNVYDAVYAEMFLQRSVRFVPSLCEYTGARYDPKCENILYYCWKDTTGKYADETQHLDPEVFVRKYEALQTGHSWHDLGIFKAIMHLPYNVSTMSVMEQYAMGVPLLFPTLRFAVELWRKKYRLWEQSTWCGTFGRAPGSVITPAGGFPEGNDPNDFTSAASLRYWLQFADYYNAESMDGCEYFGSWEELDEIAHAPQSYFTAISKRQAEYYPKRRERAVDGWRRLLEDIRL